MIDFMISATTNFLRIYVISRFANAIFGNSPRKKDRLLLVCAGFYVVNTAFFWIFHTMWINFICNLAGIFGIVSLYSKSIKTNLFVTGTIYLINMGCDVIGTMLFIKYEDGQSFDQIYEIVSVFLILVCLFLTEKIITVHNNENQELNIALIPVPLCSMALILLLYYSDICEEKGIAVLGMGLLIINFFVLYLYNQILRSVSQKYEAEMLKRQIRIYANQLDVILQSEEKAKALRHDMKHHINELKLLADRYGAAEIIEYADRMESFLHNPQEIVSSGNIEVDSVLNYMLQKAKAELKTVTVRVIIPEEIKHFFDFNVLVGNLLENAIEAAQNTEDKFLNVYIALKRGVLKIQIENSFTPVISHETEGRNRRNVFKTTKRDKDQHGIGLQNVRKIVESYNGNMEIETRGNIFSVTLILYMTRIENA